MKRSVYVSLAIFLAAAQANANGFSNESSFTAYWQVPLNISQTGQQRMAYGFRMDHLTRDFAGNQIMTTNLSQRQPLLDFRFNDRGLAGIFVHGVNLATPVALKAAEEAGAPSWLVIGEQSPLSQGWQFWQITTATLAQTLQFLHVLQQSR